MAYCVYQITNLVNGKIYVGVHQGNQLDNYWGSGIAIRRALRKYGSSAFSKSVLHECSDVETMFAKEQEIVNKEFVHRADTYNLTCGGYGGFAHCEEHKFKPGVQTWLGKHHTDETKEKLRCPKSASTRQKMSAAAKKHVGENNNFFGKHHTTTTRQKMSMKQIGNTKCVGRIYSEATLMKMRESAKRRWAKERVA